MTPARWVLAAPAVSALAVGVPATLAPASFYADFPWLASWVALLPPYNQHLVTDVGGLQLAFGLLFAWATARPAPALVVPVCLAFSLSQVLHLVFHVTHLEDLGTADAVAQSAALAFVALAPLLAARLTAQENRRM